MTSNEFIQSKGLKWGLTILAIILILGGVFQLGVFVGWQKAGFAGHWERNYSRNFIGEGRPGMGGMMPDFLREPPMMNAHGLFGSILKLDESSFSLKGQDGAEKVVLIGKDTTFNRFGENLTLKDLKVGDKIVVIGSPNQSGQIEAKFIRVFPADFVPQPVDYK